MPVLVTAADAFLGRRLVHRLLDLGGQVRAYATGAGDTGGLRAAGAIVATGDLDDEGRLDAAMTDVHTVIHAVHGPLERSDRVLLRDAATVVTAATKAQVRRLIVLSVPGASPHAGDPLRRAAARVEDLAGGAPMPSLVVRCSLVDEPRLRDALATTAPTPAQRAQAVAPVRPDDLVDGLVALDEARSRAEQGHAVFVANGPVMTLDGYLDRIGVREGLVGRVYTPAERVPLLWPSLAAAWVAAADGAEDLWAFAGLTPRAPGP